jgi:antitoxin VapB
MKTIIFQSGNSQAVRIPREFRLKNKVADISRCGDKLIIREKNDLTWNEIFAMLCDSDFSLERSDNNQPQKRDLF